MKTLCLLLLALLTSTSSINAPEKIEQKNVSVSEILKNWKYQQSRVDVKISKVKVRMAEINYNQSN